MPTQDGGMEIIMSRNQYIPPFYDDTKQDQVYCSYVERLEYPPHFHEQAELLRVMNGEIEVSINGVSKLLHKNELAVIFPQRVHFYRSPNPSKTQLITLPTDLLEDFYDTFHKYQPVYPFVESEKMSTHFEKSIKNLYSYVDDADPEFKESCIHAFRAPKELRIAKGYIQILLCCVFDMIELEKKLYAEDDGSVLKCVRFITDNYREHIQLSDIADFAGISRIQVSRIFSKAIGVSFPAYLNMLRLNYAMHLCETTDMSISDICYESGFESLSTFYYYFKKKYNATPKKLKSR